MGMDLAGKFEFNKSFYFVVNQQRAEFYDI
jgi:hypothetical protein